MGLDTRVRGKKIMVTGGCGFIGSHLVARLLADGAGRITILDSLATGRRDNLPAGDLRIVVHTLGSDPPEILDQELTGVDLLFHLAAEKHAQARPNPQALLQANVLGTHALLAAAARQRVRKVVFSSSLYAYGRMTAPPMSEEETPQPTTVYGVSKLAGEHLLAHMKRACGIDAVSLRYFFVYGPKQFAGLGYRSVIVKNFSRLTAGEPPTIHGDGEQSLDYVFIDDIVEATVRAMEALPPGSVYNVGSGQATTINALTDRMIAVAGQAAKTLQLPPDETAGSCRVASIERIRRDLDWAPTTPLDEGLRRTYAWLKTKTSS